MAIAPQVKAKDEETAVGAKNYCNFRYNIYTYLYAIIPSAWLLTLRLRGVLRGDAARNRSRYRTQLPGGSTAVDIAVIVKLTRVAMLVPVAILIGLWFGKSEESKEKDRGATFRFLGSSSDF